MNYQDPRFEPEIDLKHGKTVATLTFPFGADEDVSNIDRLVKWHEITPGYISVELQQPPAYIRENVKDWEGHASDSLMYHSAFNGLTIKEINYTSL